MTTTTFHQGFAVNIPGLPAAPVQQPQTPAAPAFATPGMVAAAPPAHTGVVPGSADLTQFVVHAQPGQEAHTNAPTETTGGTGFATPSMTPAFAPAPTQAPAQQGPDLTALPGFASAPGGRAIAEGRSSFAVPSTPAPAAVPTLGPQVTMPPVPAPAPMGTAGTPAADHAPAAPKRAATFTEQWTQRTDVYLDSGTRTAIPGEPVFPLPSETLDRKDEVSRDQYGQYRLPDINDPGRIRSYTRATTTADSVSTDKKALDKWKDETLIKGLAQFPELLSNIDTSLIGTTMERNLRDAIRRTAEVARVAVGGADGRLFGDGVHAWSEMVDKGIVGLPQVPAVFRRHVAVYLNSIAAKGLRAVPELVERIVYCPYTDSVGTLDRIYLRVSDGALVIGDVKSTSSGIDMQAVKISAQLAQYAYASHMWDPELRQWVEMPTVDQNVAYVAHIPANPKDNRDIYCDIADLNLVSGLDAVRLAATLRRMNQRDEIPRFLIQTQGTSATSDEALAAMEQMYPAHDVDQTVTGIPEQAQRALGLPESAARTGDQVAEALSHLGAVAPATPPGIPGMDDLTLTSPVELATSPRHGEALAELGSILARRPRSITGRDKVEADLASLYTTYHDVWTDSMTARGLEFRDKVRAKVDAILADQAA